MTFAKQVREVIPVLCELLYSRTSSDVLEAVAFFVSAHRFGVEDASLGIRKMLPLVWSGEASVRDAVLGSYRDIYCGQDSNAKRQVAQLGTHCSPHCFFAMQTIFSSLEYSSTPVQHEKFEAR